VGIKYKVNEKFFEKWSPSMAYVLGYIYADGSLDDSPYMRGKYIQITSTDEDSIQRIKYWLNSEHKIGEKKSNFIGGKICFILRIGSHKIYNDLFKLGLYPNKSLTVSFPKVPQKYLGHFIRGYFDGDGCIYFEKRKGSRGQAIVKRIRTIFTSGSKKFLEKMNDALKNIGISDGKIYLSKKSYQAVYNNKNSIQIFKLIYRGTSVNSFFMRKFKIFKDYFELRPQMVDLTIRRILAYHKKGHVVK
jgi:hypothetical protein